MRISGSLVAIASLSAFACSSDVPSSRECQFDSDCATQSFCREGICLQDDVIPVLTLARPENGKVFSSATFVIEGTVADGEGSGIAKCEYTVDGSNYVDLVVTDGRFSAEIAFPSTDQANMLVRVRATDRAGNEATASRTISVDRAGPTIRLVSPSKQTFNLEDLGVEVEASFLVEDATGVSSLEYSLDGGSTWSSPPSTAAFSIPLFRVAPEEPGASHALAIRAIDLVGNESASNHQFLVDTVPPSLQTNLDELAFVAMTSPNPYPASGTVADQGLERLVYQLDSASEAELSWDSTGRFTLDLLFDESEDHVEHALVFTASDEAGNSTRVEHAFVVDRVAPSLSVTTPAADAACDADACSGAVVNLASPSTIVFEGIVEDGSGMTELRLVAMLDQQPLDCSLEGTSWSCPWTLPADDGTMRVLSLRATDLAGNASVATRSVFVDRVAPVAAAPQDGRRLVPRSADLVVFSEPMRLATVRQAVTLNGSAAGDDFQSADGKAFHFPGTLGPAPYSVVDLVIGVAAEDRSGNSLASPKTARFMTEPSEPSPFDVLTAQGARRPLLAADEDGKPALLWWTPASHALRWARWDGISAWSTSAVGTLADATEVRPGSFLADSTLDGLDLLVRYRAAVGVDASTGTRAYYVNRDPTGPWNLQAVAAIAPLSTPALGHAHPMYMPSHQIEGDLMSFLDPTGAYLQVLLPGTVGSRGPFTVLAPSSGIADLHGTALIDRASPRQLFHAPNAWNTAVTTEDAVEAFYGIDQAVVGGSRTGSLWSVVATKERTAFCKLIIACAPIANGSWTSTTLPGACSRLSSITQLTLNASGAHVAIAFERRGRDGDSVGFASFPNDCSSLPSALTYDVVEGATEPAVAVGRNGTLYRAYVDTTGKLVLDF